MSPHDCRLHASRPATQMHDEEPRRHCFHTVPFPGLPELLPPEREPQEVRAWLPMAPRHRPDADAGQTSVEPLRESGRSPAPGHGSLQSFRFQLRAARPWELITRTSGQRAQEGQTSASELDDEAARERPTVSGLACGHHNHGGATATERRSWVLLNVPPRPGQPPVTHRQQCRGPETWVRGAGPTRPYNPAQMLLTGATRCITGCRKGSNSTF